MFIIVILLLNRLKYYKDVESYRSAAILFGVHQSTLELVTIIKFLQENDHWDKLIPFIIIETVLNVVILLLLIYKTKRIDRMYKIALDINRLSDKLNSNISKL